MRQRRRRGLQDDEAVALDVRPHWWELIRPIMAVSATIAAALAALVVGTPGWVHWLVAAALVAAALWMVARYMRWAGTRLIVTDRRVAERTGVFSRRGREIPLSAVTDVRYRQTLWGRIIGRGDLEVEAAGRDSRELFIGLPHPLYVQNEILTQLEDRRRAGYDRRATQGVNIPDQIDQLDQLRRRGVLTDAEFAAKKADLLGRL